MTSGEGRRFSERSKRLWMATRNRHNRDKATGFDITSVIRRYIRSLKTWLEDTLRPRASPIDVLGDRMESAR